MTDTQKPADDTQPDMAQPQRKKKFSGWVQKKFMPVEEMASNARLTSRMFSAIVGNETSQRQETFEEAVKRQSLSVDDLLGAYKRQKLITLVLLIMIVVAFGYIGLLLANGETFADYFIAAMALGPVSVLAAAALRGAFRAWQIRHKRLGGFNEFMNSPGEWWPKGITADNFVGTAVATTTPKPPKSKKKPVRKASSTA